MIKGIILDIDGVIVGEKIGFNSPNPNIAVLDRLKQISASGIPVVLCTAKPHFSITSIINGANLNNYHITDGGGVIINQIENEIVKKHVIDTNLANQVLSMYLDNNVYTEFYTVDNYVVQDNQVCGITKQHSHILQCEPKLVSSLVDESNLSEITKIMPIALNEEDKLRVTELFELLGTGLVLSWGVHPVALPLQFGIITAPNISKKQAAIMIMKKLNIPFDNVLGVGDSTSDWQFIELCKYGGAMENANDKLKELVLSKGNGFSLVGGHVDDNGIIEILDYFINKSN